MAGRHHPAVVEHQQVAGSEVLGKLVEAVVAYLAAGAVEHEQSGVVARLDGPLCDEVTRQGVVEVSRAHGPVVGGHD